MKTLRLDINCGEKTCASEPGKFCQWVATYRMGTVPFCSLFHGVELTELEDRDGWLQRCEQCLQAERVSK